MIDILGVWLANLIALQLRTSIHPALTVTISTAAFCVGRFLALGGPTP